MKYISEIQGVYFTSVKRLEPFHTCEMNPNDLEITFVTLSRPTTAKSWKTDLNHRLPRVTKNFVRDCRLLACLVVPSVTANSLMAYHLITGENPVDI